MAKKGTELRTDFTANSAQFDRVMDLQKERAKEFGTIWGRNNERLGKTGKIAKGNAQGILEMSRAFEDAQYGIRGVLNNIPGMVMGFGGGAVAAGLISVAAVGADLAFRTFGKSAKKAGDESDAMADMVRDASEEMTAELDNLTEAWERQAEAIQNTRDIELEWLKARNKVASIDGGDDPYADELRAREEAITALENRERALEEKRQKIANLAAREDEMKEERDYQWRVYENWDPRANARLKETKAKRVAMEEEWREEVRKLDKDWQAEDAAHLVRIAETNKAIEEAKRKEQEKTAKELEKLEKKAEAEQKKADAKRMREAAKLEKMIFAEGGAVSHSFNAKGMGPAAINTGSAGARAPQFRGLDNLERLQEESVQLNQKIEDHLNRVVKEL